MSAKTTFLDYSGRKGGNSSPKDGNQFFHECAVLCSMGGFHVWRHKLWYIPIGALLVAICSAVSWFGLHIGAIYLVEPNFFQPWVINWISQFYWWHHALFLLAIISFIWMLSLGFMLRFRRTLYAEKFNEAGLSTKKGRTPVPLYQAAMSHKRKMIVFDGQGCPKARFDERKDDLEAIFDEKIESISSGKKPSRIQVIFSKHTLPDNISYDEFIKKSELKPYSFSIGMSAGGPLSQPITDLPHMLITGSTGNGKSVFFKQVLMSLLRSSPYIQMYLIDLKHGLEMVDFAEAPNVHITKTINDAVDMLTAIKAEMERRFEHLESKGYKYIVPTRDKMDRIIVAVDEASVLYSKRSRDDIDYDKAVQARNLADSLAKLSRAAGINLILATQKLTSEVLPTSVTENVAGRMCFRTESLHGSLMVLGNKDATSLPDIPGRGIWSFGSKQVIAQAPYIGEKEIQDSCKIIAQDFRDSRRRCFSPMLDKARKEKRTDNKTKANADVQGAKHGTKEKEKGVAD